MSTTESSIRRLLAGLVPAGCMLCALSFLGCTPTVKVEAPDKPITINMNIKIDHEIRIRLDKDIDSALEKRKDIF